MKFEIQHSIKSINTELIKYGYVLTPCGERYSLHKKKKGQVRGALVHRFSNKSLAVESATRIVKTKGDSFLPNLITIEEMVVLCDIDRDTIFEFIIYSKLPPPERHRNGRNTKLNLWRLDAVLRSLKELNF